MSGTRWACREPWLPTGNLKFRMAAAAMVAVLAGCAPRLKPLVGVLAPASLPDAVMPPGHRTVVFKWELDDRELSARGDGAARIASPDSARLDFFVAGGFGSGGAILIGDTVIAPGGGMVRRLVPPTPLLWASLGRLALPALADTVVRVDGETLRADIGQPVAWRVTFRNDSLVRAEHVEGGRIVEWVERDGGQVRYRDEKARRTLLLTISRVDDVEGFDPSIWHFD